LYNLTKTTGITTMRSTQTNMELNEINASSSSRSRKGKQPQVTSPQTALQGPALFPPFFIPLREMGSGKLVATEVSQFTVERLNRELNQAIDVLENLEGNANRTAAIVGVVGGAASALLVASEMLLADLYAVSNNGAALPTSSAGFYAMQLAITIVNLATNGTIHFLHAKLIDAPKLAHLRATSEMLRPYLLQLRQQDLEAVINAANLSLVSQENDSEFRLNIREIANQGQSVG
jgi:hypothetical protein